MSRRAAPWVAAAVVPLLGGCTLVGEGEPVAVREYDLHAAAPAEPAPAAGAPTLQLAPFGVDPVLDRDALVWRRGEVEVGAYALHRWARPPQEAVREVLAAGLRAALPGVVVATEPAVADPAFLLRGHLARCEEVDRGERWAAVVEVHVVVVGRDGLEVLRRTYAAEEPVAPRHALGVVEALRRAAGRVAAAVARDVPATLPAR